MPDLTTELLKWPTHAPIEAIVAGDACIEEYADVLDSVFPGFGDVLRDLWPTVRPIPTCDCSLEKGHRWDCRLTPIWASMCWHRRANSWTVFDA